MLKYLSKFVLDILPSVAATIIGAYIVNHYVISKPADPPVAAAASTVEPKTAASKKLVAQPAEAELANAAPVASADLEKASAEKASAAAEKSVDKPAESASVSAESRRHKPWLHEKVIAKAAPAIAAPPTTPAVETAAIPEEHRDANDLARAAIERLRRSNEASAHPKEASHVGAVTASPVTQASAAVQPLPPAIDVATPSEEGYRDLGSTASISPPTTTVTREYDPRRLTPPGSIPTSRSVDLRADSSVETPVMDRPVADHTSVADDVLSAARSVFHAVLPH